MTQRHETASAPTVDRQKLQRFFRSVFADIENFLAEEDAEKCDELQEQLQPLCCMKRIEYTIQLAWGGPEYGFKLSLDPESREWIRGLFYWADWFKYEEEPLSPVELDKVIAAYAMDCLAQECDCRHDTGNCHPSASADEDDVLRQQPREIRSTSTVPWEQ